MKSVLNVKNVMELMVAGNLKRLQEVVDRLPDGNYRDQYTGNLDRCDGFVLLAAGHVCPIFRHRPTTLNPLSLSNSNRDAERVNYSMCILTPNPSSIENTVARYNAKIYEYYAKNGLCWYDKLIIAYHSIDPEWKE